jgi:hypothetical protein
MPHCPDCPNTPKAECIQKLCGVETEQPLKRDFRDDLTALINSYSKENGSDTPDFILADYLIAALDAYDRTVRNREAWYGRGPKEAA